MLVTVMVLMTFPVLHIFSALGGASGGHVCSMEYSVVTGIPNDERMKHFGYGKSGFYSDMVYLRLECSYPLEEKETITDQVQFKIVTGTKVTGSDDYVEITGLQGKSTHAQAVPKFTFYVRLKKLVAYQTANREIQCQCDYQGAKSISKDYNTFITLPPIQTCDGKPCRDSIQNKPCYTKGSSQADEENINDDLWTVMELLGWNKDEQGSSYKMCTKESGDISVKMQLDSVKLTEYDSIDKMPYAITDSNKCRVKTENRFILNTNTPPTEPLVKPCLDQKQTCYFAEYCNENSLIDPPRTWTTKGDSCHCWGCGTGWEWNFHTHGQRWGDNKECKAVDNNRPWCYTSRWMHDWDYCFNKKCGPELKWWLRENQPKGYFDNATQVYAYWNPFPLTLEGIGVPAPKVYIGSTYYTVNDLHIIPNERGCQDGKARRHDFSKDIECSLFSWPGGFQDGTWVNSEDDQKKSIPLPKVNTENKCVDKFTLKTDLLKDDRLNMIGCTFLLQKYKNPEFEDPRKDFPDQSIYQTYFFVKTISVEPTYDHQHNSRLSSCAVEGMDHESYVAKSRIIRDKDENEVGQCEFELTSCGPTRVQMKVTKLVPYKNDTTLPPTPTTSTTPFRTNPPYTGVKTFVTIPTQPPTPEHPLTVPPETGEMPPWAIILIIFGIIFITSVILAAVFGVLKPRSHKSKRKSGDDEPKSLTARHTISPDGDLEPPSQLTTTDTSVSEL